MINLDTNVLLRSLLMDDPVHSPKASAVMEQLTVERPGFVSLIALVETSSTLARYYDLTREQIATLISTMLESAEIEIEAAEAVTNALRWFRDSRASFADCLIAGAGAAAGCDYTITFDRKTARDLGMRLVG